MEFGYNKRDNSILYDDFSKVVNLNSVQSYIPLYKRYFNLSENNFNSIELNHSLFMENILNKTTENTYKCKINNVEENVFFKFSPLVDPIKYLVGKYDFKDDNLKNLPKLKDTYENNDNQSKKIILDENNIPYVDSFFSFLTNKLSEEYTNFNHGIKFYGSFLGIKNNFKINVYDDIDYLIESENFKDNINTYFTIDENTYGDLSLFHSRKNLKKLKITNSEKIELELDNFDFDNSETNNDKKTVDLEEIYSLESKSAKQSKSSSTCSSRTSLTNDSDLDNLSCEDEDEDER